MKSNINLPLDYFSQTGQTYFMLLMAEYVRTLSRIVRARIRLLLEAPAVVRVREVPAHVTHKRDQGW